MHPCMQETEEREKTRALWREEDEEPLNEWPPNGGRLSMPPNGEAL